MKFLMFLGAAVILSVVGASAQNFHGYVCTVDCSGHEAGYEWAERKDVRDPDDCQGNSNSFVEGCRAWTEENPEEDEPIEE